MPATIPEKDEETTSAGKGRSNSDDWLYTVSRKQLTRVAESKKRPRSLDWAFPNAKVPSALELKTMDSNHSNYTLGSMPSLESDNDMLANRVIISK